MRNAKLFALNSSHVLGSAVARILGVPLCQHEEREFEDGEHKARPLDNVMGQEVFVLHSLFSGAGQTVNDKLCRLLFFIGALRDASARRIIPIIPYLCYARKDRKTKPNDPVTTKYIAQLLEAMGTHTLVAMDVHNLPAFHNAFRCPTHHLEARKLFVDLLAPGLDHEKVTVLSPDPGGVKRAEKFREALSQALGREAGSAFMEKHRSEGVVSGAALVGDVDGSTVLVVDDLIASGGTMIRAAGASRKAGATRVYAIATHGLFTGGAEKVLADPGLDRIYVTDSVPPFRLPASLLQEKFTVVPCAPLLAEAIKRIHSDKSLTDLLAL
jgi:ribose-phosphate pyrophosphokinase